MNIWLNVLLALKAIMGNKLRTTLTFSIIAIGIMALVGILTSIDSIKASLRSNFTLLGANTFVIQNKGIGIRSRGSKQEQTRDITLEEARNFKRQFESKAAVSISSRVSNIATIKWEQEKTNPNITLIGSDENYLSASGYNIQEGRNFSPFEIEKGVNVVILGQGVYKQLFSSRTKAEGVRLYVGNIPYQVIGILEEKGSSMVSSDNMVLIPLRSALSKFSERKFQFDINVLTPQAEALDLLVSDAIGLFRVVRGLHPREENDFAINRSDKLASTVIDELQYISLAATLIGLITLLGAGIGLMNIMLVSVSERTREIGVSKALGASNKMIRFQFLTEAIVICQIGGLLGIVLGILAGNAVSLLIGGSFIIPWLWIGLGIAFCFLIGLLAGIYPALKAAKLDPIEALRYE
ncbi:MAG: ABC transporter permease [Chitinophagales bacterium]